MTDIKPKITDTVGFHIYGMKEIRKNSEGDWIFDDVDISVVSLLSLLGAGFSLDEIKNGTPDGLIATPGLTKEHLALACQCASFEMCEVAKLKDIVFGSLTDADVKSIMDNFAVRQMH